MAVTQEQRHDLYTHFQESMGRERANVMMELLPPVGWGDIATKQDLGHLRNDMRAEFAEVRGEMRAEFAEVRGEMRVEFAKVRGEIAEVRGEFAEVRGEMNAQLARVRADLKGQGADLKAQIAELRAEFHSVMRSSLLAYVGANIALIGTGIGVAKLFLS